MAGGSILVGRSGTGTMSLTGTSWVDVGNTRVFSLGTQSGGTGILSVAGGSQVLANVVNIGGELDILPTTTSVVTAGFSAAVSSTDISAASAWDLTNTWNTSNAANTITLRTLTIDRVR